MQKTKALKRAGVTSKSSPTAELLKKAPAQVPAFESSDPDAAAVQAVADGDSPWINRRATAQATRAANARQASSRRRFVDPTTCEREYSMSELEFMQAMHDYKKWSGRMFPTWSEVLEVIKGLGYEKLPANADELAAAGTTARTA